MTSSLKEHFGREFFRGAVSEHAQFLERGMEQRKSSTNVSNYPMNTAPFSLETMWLHCKYWALEQKLWTKINSTL
jgi:hypothetical protein